MTQTPLIKPEYTQDKLVEWLQSRLQGERYHHSLGAQQKAVELAENFKFAQPDIEKASLAGLLHDCAKLLTPEQLLEACELFEIPVGDAERQAVQTLHPFVGAEIVRFELGVQDAEVLNAIRYHTTGRKGMSAVEKIVYVADKIEGNTRNPLYTQKIHALFDFRDITTLDKAMLYILDSTFQFLIEKGQVIHTRSLEARNDLVLRLKQNKQNGYALAK